MTRAGSLLGTAVFFLLAPGTVAGLVPWWITGWDSAPVALPGAQIAAFVGAALIGLGLIGLLESFARFAIDGKGTPAPILPTRHLVVSGFYRWVRNPMYLSVVALIVGQGLLLGQISLLIYGACMWLVFHVFVLGYEEPTLRRAFHADYEAYFHGVPRWRPRMRPWTPPGQIH